MNRDQAVRVVTRALKDRSWKVRVRAAESAASVFAERQAPKALVERLGDRNELVRIQVAESLGDIGDVSALRPLYRALEDKSPLVRSYAAVSIGMLGGDRERLNKRLASETDDQSRLGLLAALYRAGDEELLVSLLGLLESKDFEVRTAAAATLVRTIADASVAGRIRGTLTAALRRETSVNTRHHLRALLRELVSRFPSHTLPGGKRGPRTSRRLGERSRAKNPDRRKP